MARWQLEKVAVVHLMEAAKTVMDHLRDFSMQDHPQELGATRQPTQTYAQLRRLRTHLQRCASAYGDPVELDLGDDDQNLFAAVAVFEIAAIDRALSGSHRDSSEADWLEERRRVLAHWAVEFATRRLTHVPVADDSRLATPTVQLVMRDIQRRLAADSARAGVHRVVREPAGRGVGVPMPAEPARGPFFGAPPEAPVADQNRGWSPLPLSPPPRQHGAPVEPVQRVGGAELPPIETVHPGDPYGARAGARPRPEPDRGEFGLPTPGDPNRGASPQIRQQFGVPSPPEPDAGEPPPAAPHADVHPSRAGLRRPSELADFDPKRVREPRLRALVNLDLRAYERASAAGDHRLSLVHLSSLLEGVCIDYALPRRRELGLSGSPESWSLEIILRSAMNDQMTSLDRGFLFHLAAARNLLRPAMQLANPMVVTQSTEQQLTGFVRKVLALLGLAGAVDDVVPAPARPAVGSGRPDPDDDWAP